MTKDTPTLEERIREIVEQIHHEEVSGDDYRASVDDTVASVLAAVEAAGYVQSTHIRPAEAE